MTYNVWLARHPYLQPVAELHALINDTLADGTDAVAVDLRWNDYLDDFQLGVPLLCSPAAEPTLIRVEEMLAAPLAKLTSRVSGWIAEQGDALLAEQGDVAHSPGRMVDWLLDGRESAHSGLLRFLGWTILSRQICPLVRAFAAWRDEEQWLRSYCPTCGSRPAMGQLVGTDPGRQRFLACGSCKTRWQFLRTRCPFCEDPGDHGISVLAVEGEGGLRIDYCESCHGYLKTYDGDGSKSVLLAVWTSIHLDIVASDRGLKRLAGSVYEI